MKLYDTLAPDDESNFTPLAPEHCHDLMRETYAHFQKQFPELECYFDFTPKKKTQVDDNNNSLLTTNIGQTIFGGTTSTATNSNHTNTVVDEKLSEMNIRKIN